AASTEERARLLGPYRDRIKRIVFTKHFDMGGSHYAYTDAVSNEDTLNPTGRVKEFNYRGGSSLCLLEIGEDYTCRETVLLREKDGVFRDPDVSYDGKRILFSLKKSARGDDYHLYDMNVETRKVRQLTSDRGIADYEGIYLPDGNIMFSSTRCFQNVDCWHVSVCNMYLMNGDGKHMRRIGFDQVHTNYPQVHPENGLVTYTRWEYNDRGQIYPQPLFQMYPNGVRQTEYYGNNSYFPTTILHARGIPGTGKVLAVLSGHHTHQRGKLAIIDPSRGRQETSGVTLVAPVQKPRGIIKVDKYGQGGDQWQYPYPLDEDNYLVTFRPRGQKRFGIYFMNRKGERVLLASDPAISCNQPVPLAPRPLPPRPPYPTDWRRKTGSYTIQDIYRGPGLKGVARGTVKKVRVVALDYMATDIGRKHGPSTISDLAAWDVKIVLGEAPVHEDGSAAFEVPARTPVYFQAIDAKGHVVQTMRSWSTLMPGEVFSCVGCHENKNETMPNRGASMALKVGVKPLEPFYDITGKGFSFPKMIQPILDAKCVECHKGGKTDPPDLQATPVWDKAARKFWNRSYHVLISTNRPRGPANDTQQRLGVVAERSKYLNWIGRWSVPVMIPPYSHGSSQSPLVALLEKGHEKVKMTQEELDKISCWIDLALPHSGDWTEGMKPEDERIYMNVYKRRLDWEKQEALNIQYYVKGRSTAN
ncbi:MAG: HzsA-related protein, partial [Planctomycetota bacterium]